MEKREMGSHIIRLVETNVDGTKAVGTAIRRIDGVNFMFANAVAYVSGFGDKKVNELTESEIKKLEEIITNPEKFSIPSWLLNRRKEPKTGEDKHLTASSLEFATKMDINEMKKLKTYKGIRHGLGLPVRGQRTRSSFRKGRVVGVVKKKTQPAKRK